jgi:TatD DNase family protein
MLIDSHCHPFMADFDPDRSETLERARRAGVSALIAIGYDLESSRQAVAMAETSAAVFASVTIHPHHAVDATPAALEELRALARHPRVVAIGETGLDFYRDRSPRDTQEVALRAHLGLARDLALPLVIHDRDAHIEVMRILSGEDHGLPAVVLHCFSGDQPMAEAAWRRGYYISLAGPLTYRNANGLRRVAQIAPRDRVLIETDAPYLPPEPFRGRRNEPAYVCRIAEALSLLWNVDVNSAARLTAENTRRAFRLPVASGRGDAA